MYLFFHCQMSAWEKNTARHKKPLTRLKLISRRLNDLAVTGFHTYSTHTHDIIETLVSLLALVVVGELRIGRGIVSKKKYARKQTNTTIGCDISIE